MQDGLCVCQLVHASVSAVIQSATLENGCMFTCDCTVQVKGLGSRHLTLLVGLPRASLVLVAQHPLVSLSFRPAAPHQQFCWLARLPVQLLARWLLLLVLKLLLQLAKGRRQCCCAHIANLHAEDGYHIVQRRNEMMISQQHTCFCRDCVSTLDFDVAVLVSMYMLCICTYVCFSKRWSCFLFCSLRVCLEVT